MIRTAKLSDLGGLLELAEAFVNESKWGWKFSQGRSIAKFMTYIKDFECTILVVEYEGNIKGLAMLAYDEEFHEENIGYISKFYIAKDLRGTRAGRDLLEASLEWFDLKACREVFATSTANIEGNNSFGNMLEKYNYKPCGETYVRVK